MPLGFGVFVMLADTAAEPLLIPSTAAVSKNNPVKELFLWKTERSWP